MGERERSKGKEKERKKKKKQEPCLLVQYPLLDQAEVGRGAG